MAKQAGWNIEAVLDDDIVGGDKSPGQDPGVVRVFSEGLPAAADEKQLQLIRSVGAENDSSSRELARYILEVGGAYTPGVQPTLVFRTDRYLRGGDHSAFNQQGFAAVRFTEYRENFAHQHQNLRTENGHVYGDLPEFVDFAYVANVARINAAALGSLALAPAAPSNTRLEASELTNDSTLSWDLSSDPAVTGYRVVWRSLGSPAWQSSQDVGRVGQLRLPVSKDNVVFGVQALGKSGQASLASYPLPLRK